MRMAITLYLIKPSFILKEAANLPIKEPCREIIFRSQSIMSKPWSMRSGIIQIKITDSGWKTRLNASLIKNCVSYMQSYTQLGISYEGLLKVTILIGVR